MNDIQLSTCAFVYSKAMQKKISGSQIIDLKNMDR